MSDSSLPEDPENAGWKIPGCGIVSVYLRSMADHRFAGDSDVYQSSGCHLHHFVLYVYDPGSAHTAFCPEGALSRLRHPNMGMIPPDVFIGIAEKQGMIAQVGLLQFRRVCRFVKEHEYLMKTLKNVKFNLSPSELLKKGHIQLLIDMIREYGLSPRYFQFEITETVATEYSESFCQAVASAWMISVPAMPI